jgi:guanine deaminase
MSLLYVIAIVLIILIITFIVQLITKKKKLQSQAINIARQTKFAPSYIDIPAKSNIKHQSPELIDTKAIDKYKAITSKTDTWINRAVNNAIDAAKAKYGPFAAIMLQIDSESKQVIRYWQAHNQVVATNDPTAHAEIQVIRQTCSDLGIIELNDIHKAASKLPQPGDSSYAVLYSSCEPCPMCMSACYWAKIPTLVFSATGADAELHADFADAEITAEIYKPYGEHNYMQIHYAPCADNAEPFKIYKNMNNNKYGSRKIQSNHNLD